MMSDAAVPVSTQQPRAETTGGASGDVVTRMSFVARPARVWNALMFYEQIIDRPGLHLRFLLPVPIGIEGRKSQVGDIARCLYQGGDLLKRVTAIERCRRYEFEVSEQNLRLRGGIRLLGGCYRLRRLPRGRTEVSLTTRYSSPGRPRWLFGPIESAVCHAFHRHLLGAMRRQVER